jgi:small subunit ribosomal protein S3
VGNIFINHTNAHTNVVIYTSKPALVLGRNDENLNVIKDRLVSEFGGIYQIEVREIKNPDTNAALVADNICSQIEKRLPYRRVIKAAIAKSIEKGALGIKVTIGGRLNGAEIARREVYKQGNIPLQTIRSDIDFVTDFAETMYGVIGVKVWIYKGDVFRTATTK